MANTSSYTIAEDNVHAQVNLGGIVSDTYYDPVEFYKAFSSQALFETGILPVEGSGTLSIRNGLNATQIVFQHAPGVHRVVWGSHEYDAHAEHYMVAMPYRIVIMDLQDGVLLGARHFYSIDPIFHWDQPLYHMNVPNINCRGYGQNNGVGWICLYHQHTFPRNGTLGEKMLNILERAGAGEAYNDANMDETDGARFYQQYRHDQIYLYDPHEWETKTKLEGYEWALQPDLWIPVLVEGLDSQNKHCHTGIPFTLGMATHGQYSAYYSDTETLKPFNAAQRGELTAKKIIQNLKFVASSVPTIPAPVKKVEGLEISKTELSNTIVSLTCAMCKTDHVVAQLVNPFGVTIYTPAFHKVGDEMICGQCFEDNSTFCAVCNTQTYFSALHYLEDQFICKSCVEPHVCPNCGEQWISQSNLVPSIDADENWQGWLGCSSCYTENASHSLVEELF